MRVHPSPRSTEQQVFRQPLQKPAHAVDISRETGAGFWGNASTHTHLGAQSNDPPNHKQRRWWPRPASIQARDSDMCPAINHALGPWGRTAGGGVGFLAQDLTMAKTWYHIRSRHRRTDPSTPRTQKNRHRSGAHHAQTFSPCQVHPGSFSLRSCGQKPG